MSASNCTVGIRADRYELNGCRDRVVELLDIFIKTGLDALERQGDYNWLADNLGVKIGTVQGYLSGYRIPSPLIFQRMCDLFKTPYLSIEDLLNDPVHDYSLEDFERGAKQNTFSGDSLSSTQVLY